MVCDWCGREFSSGMGRHREACLKRPTKAGFVAMVEAGLGWEGIGRRLGVSEATVRRWAQALDEMRWPDEPVLAELEFFEELEGMKLCFELAPLFGWKGGCGRCSARVLCKERVGAGLWVLCEAPEEGDWGLEMLVPSTGVMGSME